MARRDIGEWDVMRLMGEGGGAEICAVSVTGK